MNFNHKIYEPQVLSLGLIITAYYCGLYVKLTLPPHAPMHYRCVGCNTLYVVHPEDPHQSDYTHLIRLVHYKNLPSAGLPNYCQSVYVHNIRYFHIK